jgi:hypothetical protein
MIDVDHYDERTRGEVMAAVVALETSDEPVGERELPALRDGGLRDIVGEVLADGGRCLLELGDGSFTSGYADDVADELIELGLGKLGEVDRAVLAVVLLHTVAIPRAAGRITSPDWTQAETVSRDVLHQCRALPNSEIDQAVRRLSARGILRRGHRAGIRPGPQFLRLTEARSRALWEDMVLLCKPHGAQAAHIRRRRDVAVAAATAPAPTDLATSVPMTTAREAAA